MNLRKITIWSAIIIIGLGGFIGWRHWRARRNENPAYKTATVERGNVTATISADGTLIPLTSVEVKSRAGGKVEVLAVEEGDPVKKGQLIAQIDKTVSLNQFLQSQADLEAAKAKLEQAQKAVKLQQTQTSTQIKQAEEALRVAQTKLAQVQQEYRQQPTLTEAQIKQAEANLKAAQEHLKLLERGARTQEIKQAEEGVKQAKANLDNADKDLKRQEALLAKGFTSQQQVDAARAQYESNLAQYNSANEKLDLLKEGATEEEKEAAKAQVDQAKAALQIARANAIQDELKHQELEATKAQVEQAKASLQAARAATIQDEIKRKDIETARAQLQRAQAQLENAQINLQEATVIAPRDGVILTKFVEEGTVITSGMSAFAQGTTIVTIGDVTRMFVQAQVDETDIGQVKVNQAVDITVDTFPNERFKGKVIKVAPQGRLEQNVTVFDVKIEILNLDPRLKPGMTATADIIIDKHKNVLRVPNEAVKERMGKSYVEVLSNGQPQHREVKVGIIGDEYSEIISGLREGEKVVVAAILPEKAPATPGGMPGPFGPPGPPR